MEDRTWQIAPRAIVRFTEIAFAVACAFHPKLDPRLTPHVPERFRNAHRAHYGQADQ